MREPPTSVGSSMSRRSSARIRAIPYFKGRADECDRSPSAAIVVKGEASVGKTSLLEHAAMPMAWRFCGLTA